MREAVRVLLEFYVVWSFKGTGREGLLLCFDTHTRLCVYGVVGGNKEDETKWERIVENGRDERGNGGRVLGFRAPDTVDPLVGFRSERFYTLPLFGWSFD